MGFGFNLIAFPVLVLLTLGLVLYYAFSKNKMAIKILGGVWLLVVLVAILGSIIDYYRRPIKLLKSDIVGTYRIDSDIYPGKNADWQYNHFKFEITLDDIFILTIMTDNGMDEKLYGKVIWQTGPPDTWYVEMEKSHHIVKSPPTLYRSHSRFYYVFESDWGNMFFRKVGEQ